MGQIGTRRGGRGPAGDIGRCAAGLLALVAMGCAGGSDQRVLTRHDGPMPEVKPAGVRFQPGREREMGPPPYEYIRILGNAEPGWQWGASAVDAGMSWEFVGPRPMSSEYWSGQANAGGRVNSIAPHPVDPNTAYIATAGGGLWKTTDGGANWSALTDELASLVGGAVALDPVDPEVVYFGTGDMKGGANGGGLFRSLDGGQTWVMIGTTGQVGTRINSIAIDPTNTSVIHLGTNGGYRRSLDGGQTWQTPLSGSTWHVRLSPVDPMVVYLARSNQGVWRSTNGGSTFAQLGGGLPAGTSRIELAIAGSDPDRLVAAFISGSSSVGLYRTDDGGETWIQIGLGTPAESFCAPQCWYDAYVGIDPTNPDRMFVGGVDQQYADAGILRSTNAGLSWAEVARGPLTVRVHPDHHTIAWGPTGIIWEGNDGGVYKSTNGGDTWQNLNATLGAALLYDIEVHPTSVERMLGGTQDNGTPERTGPSDVWPQTQVGDGGFSVIDPTVTNRRYTTYVYLSVSRWTNNSSTNISSPDWDDDPVNFIAPLVGDPNAPQTLLGGTNRIWRTLNATQTGSRPTWTAISTDAVGAGSTINAIAVAPGNSSVIYSGSRSGKVFVTTDAATWADRSAGLPSGQISDIIIDPAAPGTAYVSFFNTSGTRVLRTENFGQTWMNMTGTLPSGARTGSLEVDFDLPVPVMYVGTGAGVYTSRDSGLTWVKDNDTLPNVNVTDLQIDRANRTIAAATYGRGAWRADLLAGCGADLTTTALAGAPGYGVPDGIVSSDDFFYYLTEFGAGNLAVADLTTGAVPGQAGYGVPDGVLSGDDFFFYLDLYAAGC
ncbi:MAG: hypothetical protein H6809_00495 [Phycisphaeraceae bacterium]|nr:hypothetical protein [Phycisphaeraceae bacterium]